MGIRTEKREVGPLSMRADVVPGSLNEEQRTVDVTWTTGARVKRSSWFDGPWYEELSTDPAQVRMERLQSGRAPVLLQHNAYDPEAHQGVVSRASLSNGVGTATLRFLTGDPAADKTWNKIRQGVLTSVSVGYQVHRSEKVADLGGVPVMRATDWEPYEISPVAMPADTGAYMRSGAQTNLCEFIIRGEAPHEETKMPDEVKPPAPEAPKVDAEAQKRAVELERQRSSEVLKVCALAERQGIPAEFTRSLMDRYPSIEEARVAVLDELAKRSEQNPQESHTPAIGRGEDARDKRLRGMGAALLERAGAVEIFERASEHKKFGRQFKGIELDGAEYRGLTLLDLARSCLEAQGVTTRGLSKMELVKRAIEYRYGMQSTSDFSILFENALHKMMLASYALADDTWRRFCGVDTVPDFRASNRYRLGSFGVADDVNESGEFKHKAVPDGSKFQITTGTKGNIIAITRQAIINDDMSALSSVATQFGRSFGLTIESNVYTLINANSGLGPTQTDTNPFFHSTRGNVNATGSALSVDGLDADRVVMGRQKDPSSNEYLNLRPRVLLVPLGLEGTANVINRAQYDTTSTKNSQVPNKVVGLFQDVVGTPRLTDTTRRYLIANDPSAPWIKVVFLEGQGEAPVLESELGFEVDGMRWKARLDVKAQMFDPKGAVTNAGT